MEWDPKDPFSIFPTKEKQKGKIIRMAKYKVCVYAIAKNEEKFVDRFMDSVEEADGVYVLDTGSSDKTASLLQKRGAHVEKKVLTPFRFDVARNLSLDMVPNDTDICVCIDLDEVLEKGWREKLESIWTKDTNRLYYNYNWSFDEYQRPKVNFNISKIHDRTNYKWTHPVHEILTCQKDKEVVLISNDITVNHYPDATKSRSNYLPLLELSVKEDPLDDRNMHYLGREYMFHGMWNESIDTLICHLNLKSATWKDERSASMRFIARCYQALNRFEEARMWLDKAMKETPYLRDPFVERALLEYRFENWKEVEFYCLKALEITTKEKTYINEPFSWDHTIYDLLSLSYYYQGKKEEAMHYIDIALEINPKDERLQKNKQFIEQMD